MPPVDLHPLPYKNGFMFTSPGGTDTISARMRRILFVICALIFACGSGCGSAPKKSASLRLAFNAPPATFDPRKSGDFLSSTLIYLIYEGLTRDAPVGVEPALAESWEVSDDGLVYTFRLRKSYWSDGRPVTASDFETSWKAVVDPAFGSLASYLMFPIKNAERRAKGEVSSDEVAIRSLDEETLQVELERPTPYFLSLTAFPLFLPYPSHADGAVYNGPFRIEKNEPNAEIRLAKNLSFWNRGQVHLDEIRIQIIPDENTALQLFERNEVDWLGSPLAPLPADSLPALKDKVQYLPMAASTFLAFNMETVPFQNLKLRQALSLSVNPERIVSEIAHGQIAAARPLPPALFDRPLEPLYSPADGAKARALYGEALSELGLSKLEGLTLYYKIAGGIEKRVAQALQREWKEALGLEVRIEQLDPKTHLEKLHRRDFQIALGIWIAQFQDPVNILERYRLPSNKKNFAGWENSRFAALVDQSGMELDPEKRLAILLEAERIFAEELPVFPLYHWTSPSLAAPRLKEIVTTAGGTVLFERLEINER